MTDGPDTILHNGAIYTVDPQRSRAEAVAIKGGRIVAVGRDAQVLALKTARTKTVDLRGAFVLPGLGDGHNHHTRGGQLDLFEVNLSPALSFGEILARVRARAEQTPPDGWVCGGIWSSALGERLRRQDAKAALDEAGLGRPVMLRDDSLHNRWVNSRALELAGITAETPDPHDGEIVRVSGAPVGLLIENASALVERVATASVADPAGRDIASTRRAVEILNSYGVTAYQDANTTLPMLRALQALDRDGGLNAWCVGSLPAYDTLSGTELFGEALIARREEFRSRHVRPDFVKLFMDGVPMTRTAAMLDAYLPDEAGRVVVCQSYIPMPELVRWFLRAHDWDMGVKLHCAGDRAVRDTLDAIEIVRDLRGPGRRHQIAHAGYVDPSDIPRFPRLNVVADLCPAIWFPSPIVSAISAVLPAERGARYWPFRDMREAGVLMAGGSDWPVVGLPNPWLGLAGMVTRRHPTGAYPGAMWPEQALDVATAVEVYTIDVARSIGLADVAGSVEVGKSADLAVLDRDLFAIPVDEIGGTRALATYFEGRLVYEAG
jgi:predicted amidohydrolase YtcJ